jgi:MFS family permease
VTAPTSATPPSAAHGWYAVALLSVASMLGYLDRSLLSLLVDPIRADLGIGDVQISLLLGFAFATFMGIASLPIAWLADRHDRIRIVAVGIAGWSAMTALGAFANDFPTLFAARVGVGIGEACLVPAGSALIADLFARDRLARANGVFALGAACGAGVALLNGGMIVQWATSGRHRDFAWLEGFEGWQAALLVAGLPGILLALLIVATLRDPRASRSASPPIAVERRSLRRFWREHRATLVTLWLAYPLAAAAAQGWLAWVPSHLMRTFSLNPVAAGAYLGGLILTFGVAGTLLGAYVTDLLFRRGRADSVLQLSIAACGLLTVCGGLAPLVDSLAVAFLLIGPFFLFAGLMAVMPVLAMQLIAPPELRARLIAGLLLASTVIGGGLGPTFVAVVNEHVLQGSQSLRQALALTAVVLCPVTAIMLQLARAPFARSLARTAP